MKPLLAKRLLTAATVTVALFTFDLVTNASSSFFWTNTTAGPNAWNAPANWSPNGVATTTDTNIFGTNGFVANSTTVNSEVTASTSVSTLLYTNVNLGQWQVTQIPVGVTLTVTTNLTVGFLLASNNNATSSVAMVDGGTLQVTGNTLTIGNSGTSSADRSTILDLSGLSNFVYSASAGTITMSTGNRSGADFKLATGSNFVTAATWNDNTASSSSTASGNVTLGANTNTINVGTFNIAAQRGSSTVAFPAGSTGGLRLRGVGGTDADRATMTLGNRSAGAASGGASTGNLNLNGHPVDIKLSTLTLGQSAVSGAGASTNSGNGILQFDTGIVDATTINMAIDGATVTNTAYGFITVGANGTLTVGAGGISLVNESVAGQTTSAGNLNISGGMVDCAGSIIKTTATGTGNLSITNGTLKMTAGNIGTSANPINVLNLNNASLHLTVSGAIASTNIVATTIATAGSTTITIDTVGGVTSPTTIPLISYTGTDPYSSLTFAPLPTGYTGSFVDNVPASRIDLSISPPPTLTWVGALSDATPDATWNITEQNWLNGASFVNYADPDIVQFGDVASNTTVTVSGTLSPGNITVDNTLSNYVFTGSGILSGAGAIVKQGSGTLTLLESGGDNFSGGIVVSGGSVLLDNANSAISGGATILNTFKLQIGNNDVNGTLSGDIVNQGALTFDRTDNLTEAGVISGGGGSVVQNGSGTMTLSGNNSFGNGLTINAGAVRASAVSSPGTSLITVNGGATFVAGAAHTNSITLTNGILGASASGGFDMVTNQVLTIAANSTNLIYSADPQSPLTSLQMLVDADLRGSGTLICMNATTNNPDNGQGVRFRNTNVVSDFSGTIIMTNNVKAELSFLNTSGGSFSPIGGGNIIMIGGTYYGTNGVFCPFGTGYSELLLRNNGVGPVTAGNNLTISGPGAAVINALGGTGGIAMGNLTIGANQELIGYKAASGVTNVTIFSSVTLTGGNATFTPRSETFGPANQAGSDIALGAISEQTVGSGITMGGRGNLTLSGANIYTGDTLITNGTLYLTNAASIASPHIVVAGGARFDVSQLASAFTLGASQTLSNSSSTAVLGGSAGTGSGTVALNYASGLPSFTVTNGTLTLAPTTTFTVFNSGAALTKGSYNIISAAASGNVGVVAGTPPASVTVSGSGIATPVTPSLQITGSQLFLVVPNSPPVVAHIVTNSVVSGQVFSITIASLSAAAGWSDVDGDTITLTAVGPTSNLGNSVTTDGTSVFYNAPVTAEDFFTYTISDGTVTANGTMYLEVLPPPPPAKATNIVVSAGASTINFNGTPNSTNVVQTTTNLLNPWVNISTNVADPTGYWQVIDPNATNRTQFYRSFQVP